MSIPVLTLPQQGEILTRPRREGCYDTEGYAGGSAIPARLSIFSNVSAFSPGAGTMGLTKTKYRDHNFENSGGSLWKGSTLHWYGLKIKFRPLGAVMGGAAAVAVWDQIRRIRESTWFTFYFGSMPYISAQTWQVPQGTGFGDAFITHNATTMIGTTHADLDRANHYDITLSGTPTTIGELEPFHMDIEASGVLPTPTLDIYLTPVLVGIFLKGITG